MLQNCRQFDGNVALVDLISSVRKCSASCALEILNGIRSYIPNTHFVSVGEDSVEVCSLATIENHLLPMLRMRESILSDKERFEIHQFLVNTVLMGLVHLRFAIAFESSCNISVQAMRDWFGRYSSRPANCSVAQKVCPELARVVPSVRTKRQRSNQATNTVLLLPRVDICQQEFVANSGWSSMDIFFEKAQVDQAQVEQEPDERIPAHSQRMIESPPELTETRVPVTQNLTENLTTHARNDMVARFENDAHNDLVAQVVDKLVDNVMNKAVDKILENVMARVDRLVEARVETRLVGENVGFKQTLCELWEFKFQDNWRGHCEICQNLISPLDVQVILKELRASYAEQFAFSNVLLACSGCGKKHRPRTRALRFDRKRAIVWLMSNNQTYRGVCYCCRRSALMYFGSWHLGHVHARSAGGVDDAHNLRAVCADCNFAMQSQNMLDFMRSRHYDQFPRAECLAYADAAALVEGLR
jgi:hypothetical protein